MSISTLLAWLVTASQDPAVQTVFAELVAFIEAKVNPKPPALQASQINSANLDAWKADFLAQKKAKAP